jgi:gamma-glutamyltranspeptidase / glutathione hydrolase
MIKNIKCSALSTIRGLCIAISCIFTSATLYAQSTAQTIQYDTTYDVVSPIQAKHGMVSSEHGLASQAGLTILQRGGNAVDASVAMGFALAVVLPSAGNIGGGGFMLIHDAKTGKDTAIDFRELAPALANRTMFLDAKGNVIPQKSTSTHLAVGVPGTVAGLHLALSKD